jgi:hypothetical protein
MTIARGLRRRGWLDYVDGRKHRAILPDTARAHSYVFRIKLNADPIAPEAIGHE